MGRTINLVMTTDENYIVPTMVTLSSVLASSMKECSFHVYILCAPELSGAGREMLKKLERLNSRIEIIFKEVRDSRLDEAITTAHIPIASYYRLYISKLIMEERCLFIDGDMIIRGDLSEVYHIDLENYYVAAVKDLGIQCHLSSYRNYADSLGILSMDQYVNAGFMLFNLKQIRKDHVDQRMIEAISEGYKYMDQDIINKYCYGKIKILPLKYDFFTEYYGSLALASPTGYTMEEMLNIEEKACVLHFTGYFKPWICTRLKVNILWWKEAEKVLDSVVYHKVLGSAREAEWKSDWNYIKEVVGKAGRIVICGYSEIGKKVANRLLRDGAQSIVAFSDNDKMKVGCRYRDIPVIFTDNLKDGYEDTFYIISSQNGFRSIRNQLKKIGVKDNRIIRYVHKDETYFARLSKKYVEYEKEMQ